LRFARFTLHHIVGDPFFAWPAGSAKEAPSFLLILRRQGAHRTGILLRMAQMSILKNRRSFRALITGTLYLMQK